MAKKADLRRSKNTDLPRYVTKTKRGFYLYQRRVPKGLPRIAHLVAGACDFRLDRSGNTYERTAPLPLGKEERGVGLNTLRDRFAAIIHALDPAGVLWTMAKA